VYDQEGGYDIDTVSIQVMDNAPQIADIPDTNFLASDTLVLDLGQFASDCDDRLDALQWDVTGNTHLAIEIGIDHLARIFSPGFLGQAAGQLSAQGRPTNTLWAYLMLVEWATAHKLEL